jgi:hypothetical protein
MERKLLPLSRSCCWSRDWELKKLRIVVEVLVVTVVDRRLFRPRIQPTLFLLPLLRLDDVWTLEQEVAQFGSTISKFSGFGVVRFAEFVALPAPVPRVEFFECFFATVSHILGCPADNELLAGKREHAMNEAAILAA